MKLWNNYIAVPEEEREWGIMLLPCFFTAAFIVFICYYREGIRKMLLHYTINQTGIFCSGLTWNKFCLQWDEVQTYGVAQYTFYYHMIIIYFWREKGYIANAKDFRMTVNKVSYDHVAFEYSPELIASIQQYAPKEIAQNIQDALKKGISVHRHIKHSTRDGLREPK